MTHQKHLKRHILSGLVAVTLLAGLAASVEAVTITRTGSDAGGRKAWVQFSQTVAGGALTVRLANISPNDVDGTGSSVAANDFMLTGVFFNLNNTPALTKTGATLIDQINSSGVQVTTDSSAFCASGMMCAPPAANGNVGGEWGYIFNAAGLGKHDNQTALISTEGYGISGWNSTVRFDTSQDLSGGATPDAVDYGITSFGDNTTTTNADLGANVEYIKNAIQFTFNVPAGYVLATVDDVTFQYNVNAATHPSIDVPLPGALVLLGAGVLGLSAVTGVRRRRNRSRLPS